MPQVNEYSWIMSFFSLNLMILILLILLNYFLDFLKISNSQYYLSFNKFNYLI